jgi:hypothetical protein
MQRLLSTFLKSALAAAALFAATAATPTPRPSATPNPFLSFSAVGSLSLKAEAPGKSAGVRAEIHVAHDNMLTRIDVLNVAMTADNGMGPVSRSMPIGALSVVIDQAKGLLTLWSSKRPVYYQVKLPFQRSVVGVTNGLSALAHYDVVSASLNLVGHKVIDGHMASLLAFALKTKRRGGKLQSVVGHLALADDLSGMPLRADVAIGPGETKSVKIQMDLSSISAGVPSAAEFAFPKGYTRTTQLGVILAAIVPPPPSPRPTATQTPP